MLHFQGLVGEPTPQGWAVGTWNTRILGLVWPLGLKKTLGLGNSMSRIQAPFTNFPFPGGGAGPPAAILDCFTIPQAQGLSPWPLESSHAQHWPVALPHLCAGCNLHPQDESCVPT